FLLPLLATAAAFPTVASAATGGTYHVNIDVFCTRNPNTGNPVFIARSHLTKPGDYQTEYIDFSGGVQAQGSADGLSSNEQWGFLSIHPYAGHTYRSPNYARRKKTVFNYNIRLEGDPKWFSQSFRLEFAIRWRKSRYNPITKLPMRDSLSKTTWPLAPPLKRQDGFFHGVSPSCTFPASKPKDPNPPPDQTPPADDPSMTPPTSQPPQDTTKVCPDGSVIFYLAPCPIAAPPGQA